MQRDSEGYQALMRLHVAALFTHDSDGRLIAVNEPDGGVPPTLFFGRTSDGNVWRFRHAVEPALAAELNALCEAQPRGLREASDIRESAPLVDCLRRHGSATRLWAGPTFLVPHEATRSPTAVRVTSDNVSVLSPYLEAWSEDVSAGAPVVVALEEGRAVSLCASVRITPRAHEAGVETHPDFRRRGYGARAVGAWAALVRELGCLPLYSTSWTNEPSRSLARRLSLIQFGTTLHAS